MKQRDILDQIDRVTVEYRRIVRKEILPWEYSEQLVLERESETLSYTRSLDAECIVSQKLCLKERVSKLLDTIDTEELFGEIVGNPEDVVEDPTESQVYTLTVDLQSGGQRILQGSYDKKELPAHWGEFAGMLRRLLLHYSIGEVLDPAEYERVRRCKGDYLYCSVEFEECGKSYYYISEDDSIEEGEWVLVPAGKDNRLVIVEVVDTEFFAEADVPLPLDKTKRILRRCTEEDLNAYREGRLLS